MGVFFFSQPTYDFVKFSYDGGSGFSQKTYLHTPSLYCSTPYIMNSVFFYDNNAISYDGSYFAYLEKPSVNVYLIVRNFNSSLYANLSTGFTYQPGTPLLSLRFLRNGSTDYLYLINR